MANFNVGDVVYMNPTSRWVKQGFDPTGTPYIGKVVESSHGFYDYGVEWDYRTYQKVFYYNNEDLLHTSYRTNHDALFLLHKNKIV
jgi:hypothetical protein